MRIMIESTTRVVTVNGEPARIWEGATESGIPVQVMVTRIAAEATEDLSQFAAELLECKVPSATAEAFPLRMIL